MLFLLCLFLISCDSKETKVEVKTKLIRSPLLDDDIAELFQYYYEDPLGQDQIDENIIINYVLDQNLKVERTLSGLYYCIDSKGVGPKLYYGQAVQCQYKGYFIDGRLFDSSLKKNKPIKFNVGEMIPAWNEAMLLMNKGSNVTLFVPSRLAYGQEGLAGFIPPNTVIIFEIEVLVSR